VAAKSKKFILTFPYTIATEQPPIRVSISSPVTYFGHIWANYGNTSELVPFILSRKNLASNKLTIFGVWSVVGFGILL